MVERRKRAVLIIAVTAAYFIFGKLGLALAVVNPSATAVWANAGLALAALLTLGYGVWPGIFLGAFLVNFTTTGRFFPSAAIATGNTLEAVIGAWLTCRFANGKGAIFRTQSILSFLTVALLSTALSATIGATTLVIAGLETVDRYLPVWLVWWLGDATGVAVITPIILLWTTPHGKPWKWSRFRPEAVALLVSVFVVAQVIFNGALAPNYALAYLCMPFFAWAAFRFGQREAAVTMFVFAASAIWATFNGIASSGPAPLHDSLLMLQVFLGVGAVTNIVLATEVAERRRAEGEALALATVDSLTGLGNHRKFIEDLDAEIRRAERSGRSFALMLIDLDGLKRINDSLGHLVGNRALCRVADVIRYSCRAGDTAARYGGDEFAVILMETDTETAHRVAGRIRRRIAVAEESPAMSVSVGVAIWPHDGLTMDILLGAADSNLYAMKNRSGEKPRAVQTNHF